MNSPAAPRSRKDRDAGLQRIKTLTRWSLAGALTGTGVFAGLAAHAGGTAASAATKTAGQSTATSSISKSTTSTASSATDGSSTGTSATTTPTTATPVTVAPSSGSATIVSGAS